MKNVASMLLGIVGYFGEARAASDQTVTAIAGHVSPKMLAHYSHVRLEAKRKALDALGGDTKEDGYLTSSLA
jgi:hypothetical protein